MNPEGQEPQILSTSEAVPEYNWMAIFTSVAVVGVVVVVFLVGFLFFHTTKKLADKSAQQMQQIQKAEAAYDNPFDTPTPTYQNPFSVATADASSGTQSYRNPFEQ